MMLRTMLLFGLAAGLIVIVPMSLMMTFGDPGGATHSPLTGYAIMLLALSLVFVGVKRHRDQVLGGVIKFVPALLLGLGISAVAAIVYMIGWEITLAATNFAFIDDYAAAAIEAARAKGSSPEEVDALAAQMDAFKAQYANPLFRMPITFIEIFPVGILVSLISAGLLRNARFLPARNAQT